MTTLELDAVDVTLGGANVVDALSLDLASGEVVGLVGPNGSGKSTALRCVYRALRPTAGVVRVDGADVRSFPLRVSARSVAALTQQHESDLDFTVAEVVALGRAPYRRGNQPLSQEERAVCRDAMARLDVLRLADRGVLTLSGGERQRVLVARALAQEPSLLVLDEPTNHLDLRHQLDVLSYVKASGLTVLVALHDLNLAASACDRLAVMKGGQLIDSGTVADVLTPALVKDVFGVDVTVVTHPRTHKPQLLYELGSPVTAKGTPG